MREQTAWKFLKQMQQWLYLTGNTAGKIVAGGEV